MRTLAAVAIPLLVAGCQAPPPPEQTDAEVREAIARQVDLFEDGMLRGDPAVVLSLYTSDAQAFWPGMDLVLAERQDFVEGLFNAMTFLAYSLTVLNLWVHEDVAYGIYEESETFQMEGQEPETGVWNCFFRWEKEYGVWKIDRTVCGPRDAPPEG